VRRAVAGVLVALTLVVGAAAAYGGYAVALAMNPSPAEQQRAGRAEHDRALEEAEGRAFRAGRREGYTDGRARGRVIGSRVGERRGRTAGRRSVGG
jgi:flagellar biosynthesis/type III secretory pathway protein FliH